jgi:hypothetical protein
MSKCLTVVAFALLVLSGAMGLRMVTAANAATSSSGFTMQGRPFPPPHGGGMQGRPFPPPHGGGMQGRPFPPPGGGH